MVATREAYGNALARIGEVDPRIVAMDGDTKNSTYRGQVLQEVPGRGSRSASSPSRYMVGVAVGFGTRGKVPFASTFACFFTRAYDQIRVAGHFAGEPQARRLARRREHRRGWPVADGAGGPGHDAGHRRQHRAVCQRRGVRREAGRADGTTKGTMLSCAPRGPRRRCIYNNDEQFPIGGAKVLRQSANDKVTVVAAGVTLYEALKAADALKTRGYRHHSH